MHFWFRWLIAACVLPGVAAAAFVIVRSYEKERSSIELGVTVAARALMQAVDGKIEINVAVLQGLALSPSLKGKNFASFQGEARRLLEEQGSAANIILTDSSGQMLVNTFRPYGEPLPRVEIDGSSFRRVFDTGKPSVSDLFMGSVGKKPIISIGVPVLSDGKTIYLLAIGMYPDDFAKILQRQRAPPDWVITILDTTGTSVARSHSPDKFVGKKAVPDLLKRIAEVREGTLPLLTLEGVSVLAAFSTSTLSGWTVAIGVPSASLTGNLRDSLLWSLLGSAALLIVVLLVAREIKRRFVQSIQDIAGQALVLADGKPLSIPPTKFLEIAEIGDALEKASHLLAQREAAQLAAEAAQQKIIIADSVAAQFRELLDAALDAAIIMDSRGQISDWNDVASTIFGWTRAEVVGSFLSDVIIPAQFQDTHRRGLEAYLRTGVGPVLGKRIEVTALRKSGEEFPVELSITPYADGGELVFVGFLRDITDRKREAERLERQARKAKLLYEVISFVSNANSFEAALATCLEAVQEVTGWPVGHVYVPSDRDPELLLPSNIWRPAAADQFQELKAVTAKTRYALGEGLPGRVMQTGEPLWITDVRNDVEFLRARHSSNLGITSAIGFPIKNAGTTIAVMEFFTPVQSPPNPELLFTLRSIGDQVGRVFERRLSEKKLQQQWEARQETQAQLTLADRVAAQFRGLLEAAPDAMVVVHRDGRISLANKQVKARFGYRRSEIIGQSIELLLPEYLRAGPVGQVNRSFANPVVQAMGDGASLDGRRKDGTLFPVEVSQSLIEAEGESLMMVAVRDISDRKRLEVDLEAGRMQLLASARLSALGTMAGGIAHEVNNPLAVIHAAARELLDMGEEGSLERDDVTREAGQITKYCERIAAIVKSLRHIARDGDKDPFTQASVNEIVEHALTISSQRFREHSVDLITSPIDPLLRIKCREVQISQVLTNLLQNAFDAVQEKSGGKWVRLEVTTQDDSLIFSVIDSGRGIPSEVKVLIMEAFFTTKPVGKGTGLGLSLSKQIAEEHGGTLEYEERDGHTCFRLCLPLSHGETSCS